MHGRSVNHSIFDLELIIIPLNKTPIKKSDTMKHSFLACILSVVAIALATTTAARAAVLTINPASDTLIADSSLANSNYNGISSLEIGGQNAGYISRSLFQFDVSALGSTVIVSSIKLSLTTSYVMNPGDLTHTITLHEVSQSWTPSQVTWNDRATSTAWTPSAGGTYAATAIGSYDWNFPSTSGLNSSNINFIIDILPGAGNQAARNSLINSWYSTPASNFGLLLKMNTESSDVYGLGLRSTENTGGGIPSLEITYTAVPEPSSMILMLAGSAGLVFWGRRRRHGMR